MAEAERPRKQRSIPTAAAAAAAAAAGEPPLQRVQEPTTQNPTVKSQPRTSYSFAGVIKGVACEHDPDQPAPPGCYPPVVSGTKCDENNVKDLQCDLRTLKVPPYYALVNPTDDKKYAVYYSLTDTRKMILQLMCARKMMAMAVPILVQYSTKVVDNHLLPFKGISTGNNTKVLSPVDLTNNVTLLSASRTYWVPRYVLDIKKTAYMNVILQDVSLFRERIASLLSVYGIQCKENSELTRYPSAEDYQTFLSNVTTDNFVSRNEEIHLAPNGTYIDTFVSHNVRYLLNVPFVTMELGKPNANPKYISSKYVNGMEKNYAIGKGQLLTAFEHMLAAAKIFKALPAQIPANQPEYHNLTEYEYNAMAIVSRMLELLKISNVSGSTEYIENKGKPVFKKRILKFVTLSDWIVYHTMTEVLIQYYVEYTGLSKNARRRQKSLDFTQAHGGEQQRDSLRMNFVINPDEVPHVFTLLVS
ncbi:MAG: hypothetical protein PHN45_01945 [Methylococcales bacterium]|nr:hypothetical protein [Methylococcales bacterium]